MDNNMNVNKEKTNISRTKSYREREHVMVEENPDRLWNYWNPNIYRDFIEEIVQQRDLGPAEVKLMSRINAES
jgi:hypothetical protein